MSEQEKKSISFEDLYGMQSEAFYDLIMQSDQSWRKSWASSLYTSSACSVGNKNSTRGISFYP